MFIVLPPSETKARPNDPSAPTLDLNSWSFPELNDARRMMLRAAARTATMRDGGAMLGLPTSAPELLPRMAHIESEPVGRPLDVYTGVLFDALGAATLPGAASGGIDGVRVIVTSALFGIVDCANDAIPAYRLSAGSTVSRLGKASTWWKKHLAPVAAALPDRSPVTVDCRSGAYRSMMPLKGECVLEVVPVAEVDGKRKVVSHDAKRYRGLVARALLKHDAVPQSPSDVVDVLRHEFGDALGVELTRGSHASVLTIVDRWEKR